MSGAKGMSTPHPSPGNGPGPKSSERRKAHSRVLSLGTPPCKSGMAAVTFTSFDEVELLALAAFRAGVEFVVAAVAPRDAMCSGR